MSVVRFRQMFIKSGYCINAEKYKFAQHTSPHRDLFLIGKVSQEKCCLIHEGKAAQKCGNPVVLEKSYKLKQVFTC